MKIAFNPSTVAALITPPNNKDITFDLRGRNIFARGVKFCGTDTWRDIKINNVSIGSNILDLRNGSNTTLTNTNGVVTINSTWRPVVDNLTSDSTTSSLSANQGRILKALIDGKSNSGHTHDDRYLKLTGGTMTGNIILSRNATITKLLASTSHYSSVVSWSVDGETKKYGREIGLHNLGGSDSTGSIAIVPYKTDTEPWSGTVGLFIAKNTLKLDGKPIAFKSDIPSSLKNPYSLTLLANGITLATYDGSVSKIVNLTYDNVGAAAKNHTHNSLEPWASYITGDSHATALKSIFDKNKTSIPRNKFISMYSSAYDNGSYYMGYFLLGYENNPYGGFFVAHYDTAYYIEIYNGSFTQHRLAYSTDIPNSLKNPHALTISLNGTSQGPYDGSAAKNINITPGSIGAATSEHNHDNRYLKLTGGTMQLGEGLKFHADDNYFGTNSDARIISLLDGNDKICDGGLIIDERGTFEGKEHVTELLRIRDSEFKWKGSNILHSGNSNINGNTITINGSSLTVSKSDHTHSNYVTNLGTSGNYLTWTKNGSTNNITVPYATTSSYLTNGFSAPFVNKWDCNAPDRVVYSDYGSDGRLITNHPSGWHYGTLLELGHTNNRGLNGLLNILLMWDVAHNTTLPGTLWFRGKDEVNGWAKSWAKVITDLNISSILSNYYTKSETDGKYVTLTTTLTIGGSKTFTTGIKFNTNKNGDANLGSNDGFKLFYNETSGRNFPGSYYNVASFITGYTGFLLACYGGADLALKYRHREDNGTWHPWKTLAFTTDIPSSLKNPYSLTLKANGTTLAVYDGSSAKEVNFTYTNVGAASASHTHPYLPLSGAFITGTNIADMKVNIRNYFNGKPAGTNCYIGSSNIYNFLNDSAECSTPSICGIMALNPGYDNYNHGHFLVSHYGDNRIGMIGLGYLNWYGPNWFAYTSDIPIVTDYYWANIKVSASSSTSTSPTFGSLWINNSYFFKLSGTTFTCQGGTTFTLPSSNINTSTALLWTTASDGTRDTGIFYNSSDFAFIANSSDHGAVFAVYDTDVTQDFEAGVREISVPGSGGALWARGGFSKSGSSNDYVLLGGGGHKLESSLNVANADTVDGYHASSLVKFYLSPMANDAPADSAKSWFINTMPSASAAIVYNVPGSEKTIIAGKSSGAFGHMLQLNYDDTYLRILRYYGGSWKSTDWEKISAGYADSAGSVSWNNITGKPSSFTPSAHTHSWTSITDKLVAGNEFNIVNAGFNNRMWFNYLPINDRSKTATISYYCFGNGNGGYASVTASGFVKNGSSSSYVLLGDGGHQTISSLSVNYANSAGNADTALYLRSLGNLNCQTGRTLNYGDVYTYNTYDGNTGSPTTFTSVIGFGRGIAGTVEIAGGWDNTNLYWRSLRDCCEDWHSWRTVLDSSNYTEYINNYYWANVKISTSSSTTTSPTVSNLTATSSIRMGNIYLLNTDEINNSTNGSIYLNYRNSGNVSLCYGGGSVGIGTTSPTYKLDVNGDIHSSGTINCNALNVSSTLNVKDSVISCSAGNISILSKESGSLLINSREVLHYDSDFIYMNNRIDLLHGLCFRTSTLDTTYSIYTTDDVTVLIGVLRDNASFKFRPAKDGLLLFLKIGKLYSNTYFWCTAENCVVVRAKDFGIYLDKDQNKDCFGDGLARIFIYTEASNRWYEFYCG